jgi:hypothetical protein
MRRVGDLVSAERHDDAIAIGHDGDRMVRAGGFQGARSEDVLPTM